MQFEEVWQHYDFTEAELLSMVVQRPNNTSLWLPDEIQYPNDYVHALNNPDWLVLHMKFGRKQRHLLRSYLAPEDRPLKFILILNYYWDLNSTSTSSKVATEDRPLILILESCLHANVRLNIHSVEPSQPLANLGTIIGWGQIEPSPWLQTHSLSESEWMHLYFDIGGNNRIEAICRSLSIEQLTPTHPVQLER